MSEAAKPFSQSGGEKKNRRVRTPTILQMTGVECGVASLAMVLAHYGAWVSIEELRTNASVTRDGSKASNLLKAARKYNLSAKGFKKEPAALNTLPLPSIIHWNFNHYVVFEGIRGGYAYINDPASGPRKIPVEEFSEYYTGVVLVFEPAEDFTKQGAAPGLLGSFSKRLSGSWAALCFVLLISLALVIPGITIAGFSKIFVDSILIDEKSDWLVPLILGICIAALFRGGLTWLQQSYLLRMETKLALSMASRFLWHLIRLPADFFNQRHAGDLADRMAANDRIAMLLSGQLATNSLNLAMVIFYGLAIALFDGLLALIAFGMAAMNLIALKIVNRKREDLNRSLLADYGKLAAATVGSLRAAETLKASGTENDAFRNWAGYQAKMLLSQRDMGGPNALLTAFPMLMTSLTTAAILGVGGYRVMEGSLSVGSIVAIQSLMASFTGPIKALVDLGGQLQKVKGDIARLDDVETHSVYTGRGPSDEGEWEGPAQLAGQITLDNVSFGYSPIDPPLLTGVSLELRPGARVALVGGSGCGKSTLGRLAAGILSPREGEIRIDGYPIETIPPHVFAATVSYVDQDIFLFEGTVRDNLSLWNSSTPTRSLTQALKDAAIHEEVMERPGQYEGMLEEGGMNYSGGQRQRLEIARALASDPRILILDEATSALDSVTEKLVDDNLRRRGCTCLIIAHRMSTIRDCDEIIVLDRGQIVERGTHDDLLAANGAYTRLIGIEG